MQPTAALADSGARSSDYRLRNDLQAAIAYCAAAFPLVASTTCMPKNRSSWSRCEPDVGWRGDPSWALPGVLVSITQCGEAVPVAERRPIAALVSPGRATNHPCCGVSAPCTSRPSTDGLQSEI